MTKGDKARRVAIVMAIEALRDKCEEYEYTDTQEVWDLLDWIQATLYGDKLQHNQDPYA